MSDVTGLRMFWRRNAIAVIAISLGIASLAALTAARARADAFGQITSWGSPGTGAGQFFRPTELGVDPTDNSVYVLDRTADESAYRLQKFSSSGTLIAGATIPREPGANGHIPILLGVAVDPGLQRLYLLQIEGGADTNTGSDAADQILVFSTVPSGSSLVAPSDVPSGTLPVPSPTGADALDKPRGFAVDPTTHDLLVLAYDPGAPPLSEAVIQRIGSDGTAGARFIDSSHEFETPDEQYKGLHGLAVGPDGSVYVGKGGSNFPLDLYKLPPTLASVSLVAGDGSDGSLGISQSEKWNSYSVYGPYPFGFFAGGGGEPLAISPDGTTAYWNEILQLGSEPGNFTVRGFSLVSDSTSVVYGGNQAVVGSPGSCEITRIGASVAAGSNGVVYVLDPGNFYENPPTYGARVVEFGPGGSGCPAPVSAFSVDGGSGSEVTVQKGASVTFDASGSELHGASPSELDWDLDGSGAFATQVTGSPAELTVTHQYLQVGTFTVGLKMVLASSSLGNPPVVYKTVHVVPGTPTASFTASDTAPASGETVHFDASGSVDPTGSASAGPTHTLKSYAWDFGDGTTQETTTPTVEHAFSNTGSGDVARTVKLTVTSNDEATSAPATRTITVKGTPAPAPPTTTTTTTTPPPPTILPSLPTIDRTPTDLKPSVAPGQGLVALTVSCPISKLSCGGSVQLTTTTKAHKAKGKKTKQRHVVLGQGSFTLTAGARSTVRISLSATGLRLLKTEKTLKVTVTLTAHDSYGDPKRQTLAVTLHTPTKKHK